MTCATHMDTAAARGSTESATAKRSEV